MHVSLRQNVSSLIRSIICMTLTKILYQFAFGRRGPSQSHKVKHSPEYLLEQVCELNLQTF